MSEGVEMTNLQRAFLKSVGPLGYRKNPGWGGYKYRVERDFLLPFILLEAYGIHREDIRANWSKIKNWCFLDLSEDGIIIRAGYCSDGASGPTIDDDTNRLATIGGHDPLYQLMRLGVILPVHRLGADTMLRDCCIVRTDMIYVPSTVGGWKGKLITAKNAAMNKLMHARYAAWKFCVWEFAEKASTSRDESATPCLEAP